MIRRVRAWWAERRRLRLLTRWERSLPEWAVIAPADDWAEFPVGTVVDVASWTMPERRSWPLAFPEERVGSFKRRVAPAPRGPQAVRIVSWSPAGDRVAYEVVR